MQQVPTLLVHFGTAHVGPNINACRVVNFTQQYQTLSVYFGTAPAGLNFPAYCIVNLTQLWVIL